MRPLTEDEHIALVEAGNEFCADLAEITARQLVKFPPDLRDNVLYYLGDHTSLFSPYTFDRTQLIEKVKRQSQ